MLLLLLLYNDLYFYLFDCTNFIPAAGLVIPREIGTNEANAKIKTQTVIVLAKTVKRNLNICMPSYIFHSLNHYVSLHLKDHFLFHLFLLI